MNSLYRWYFILFLGMKLYSQSETAHYLALGDSYTIGESVQPSASFPVQLQRQLGEKKIALAAPRIVARTGWTTSELAQAMDQAALQPSYDLVTLLIGVNNQYRGQSLAAYEQEFEQLLDRAVVLAKSKKEHVIVLSIPDYGYTPFGAGSKAQIGKAIDAFNAVNKRIAEKKGVHYLDITPISRQAEAQPELVAADRLHPSEAMYRLWAQQLLPVATRVLNGR